MDDDNEEHTKALKGSAVTVLYNLARLAEQGGKLHYADRLYRCILKQRPNYTDAFTRLGQIR